MHLLPSFDCDLWNCEIMPEDSGAIMTERKPKMLRCVLDQYTKRYYHTIPINSYRGGIAPTSSVVGVSPLHHDWH